MIGKTTTLNKLLLFYYVEKFIKPCCRLQTRTSLREINSFLLLDIDKLTISFIAYNHKQFVKYIMHEIKIFP